jgi:outer membrane lipoprotein carrier protein
MMNTILNVCVAMAILTTTTFAQKDTNDPLATKLLDKVSKKYNGHDRIDLDFSLTVEVPGQKKTLEKGKISQAKEAYRLMMDQQTIICDGKTNWIYLKKSNEVQISDANPNETDGLLTPRQLLKVYQNGDYIYAITDRASEGGVVLTHVEFKPVNKSSEYSKIRLSINEKTGWISSVKAFAKDGSRYTFALSRHNTKATYQSNYFTFDQAQFPGARVEDLRM